MDSVAASEKFFVQIGESVTFSKTVGETDIYLFAGITGDFSVNHVNEQYMAQSKFGHRIAHGALIIGYMSTCSTMMIDQCRGATRATTPVSLGYDRVRFLAPVFIGDTVTLTYSIAEIDAAKRRSLADVKAINQHGTLVALARHILSWVDNTT
jgi:3-hydroxybutyryl-CoA dehydratase